MKWTITKHMRIDLHTHTINSDGLLTVPGLVTLARARRVQLLALTDHDTMAGAPHFLKLCEAHHILALPGVEISTKYAGLELHILALNPHKNLEKFSAHLERQIKKRKERAKEVVTKLKKAGFFLSDALEKKLFALPNIGKPHLARAYLNVPANKKLLQNEFYCKTTVDNFIKHILDEPGQAGYVAKERISTRDAIKLIHTTGAKAVLAHPQFDLPKNHTRKQCCDDLKTMELDGIEAVNGRRHLEQRAEFVQLAKHYGWLMTVGSDTHNTTQLGINVSKQMYATLRSWLFA